MATVTASRAAASQPVKDSINNGTVTVCASYSITANPTASDVLQLVPVPRGARVIDVVLAATDLDTNGTPTITMTVGDGGSANRFITTSTIGQTGGVARLNNQLGHLYEYTADDTIDVTFGVASATFASGTITLTVTYTTDSAA